MPLARAYDYASILYSNLLTVSILCVSGDEPGQKMSPTC